MEKELKVLRAEDAAIESMAIWSATEETTADITAETTWNAAAGTGWNAT